jgi:hypothetical protein
MFYTNLIFLTELCKVMPLKLITHLTDTITTWVITYLMGYILIGLHLSKQ